MINKGANLILLSTLQPSLNRWKIPFVHNFTITSTPITWRYIIKSCVMGSCFSVALKLCVLKVFSRPFDGVKWRKEISALFNIHNGERAEGREKIYIDYRQPRQVVSSETFHRVFALLKSFRVFTVRLKIHRFASLNLSYYFVISKTYCLNEGLLMVCTSLLARPNQHILHELRLIWFWNAEVMKLFFFKSTTQERLLLKYFLYLEFVLYTVIDNSGWFGNCCQRPLPLI